MRKIRVPFDEMVSRTSPAVRGEVSMEFDVSDRINGLMEKRGMSRAQLAKALGKRPCEVTRWLSGQHNFTLGSIARLSSFFGEPIISVARG